LERLGYVVIEAESAQQAIACLGERRFEVVVTDLSMPPGASGLEVVRALRARQPSAAAIVLTGQSTVTDCVDAMRAGANDFVAKPFHPESLADVIRSSVESMRIPHAPTPADARRRASGAPAASLLGASPAIRNVLALVQQVASTPTTVLVTGKTGTGKEVVARLIHGNSRCSSGPFVAVNCGAIPENLIESELFGHARGAFTGAAERRVGYFAQADKGTLFLDEIGELPLSMQVRLLRVLQTREVQALGETKPLHVDIRIIAATNRDLLAMAKAGSFREDLYYRLNVVQIELPPLCERSEDIAPLFELFLARNAALLDRSITVSPEVYAAMARYAWPGNVRELENLAERMVILNRSGVLTVDELPRELVAPAATRTAAAPEIQSIVETGLDLEQTLEATKWRLIDEAMRRADGNRAEAARLLGINRTTLVEKLKRREPLSNN
jgi:DNA-binding NtrC family response regulator